MAFLGGEGQDGLARCRVLMDLGDHGGALAHGGRNALDRPGAHIAWGSTSTQGKRVTRLCEIESTARKREDILLQDIGLRVWAETMAMKTNRATQQDAAPDDTPISKGFRVRHETGNC